MADGEQYDVAIVGYGPVGQCIATLLGRKGWTVVAFDRQPGLFPLPRACHLDHEGMRILQAMGIASEVDAAIVPAREYLLLRPDLSVISDLPRGWETPSGWESSYHFFQPDIEGILDAAARATPGVTVRQSTAVTAVQDRGDDVLVTLDGAGGAQNPEQVRARFVIGADGANSLVRTSLGIASEDLGFQATWVVIDVEIREGHPLPAVPDTGQVLDPAQPRHMAWLGGRHYRWEFMITDGADPIEAARPENVWPKLRSWVDEESAILLRSTAYTFRSLVAETFHRGRMLLAGDAAHLMPPFMGQGMVSGMRDAATLAWVLDLVLRGHAPVEFLGEYTDSRRPHVTAYIAESVRVGQLVCETDPVKAAARDLALEAQTESSPPFQPPVGGFFVPGPLSGRLAVQPRIANHGGRLLDDMTGGAFTLLSTEPVDSEELSEEATRAIRELRVVTGVVRPAGEIASAVPGTPVLEEEGRRLTDWLAEAGADWTIVRPDGYVYDAGRGRDALDRSLAGLLSRVLVAA